MFISGFWPTPGCEFLGIKDRPRTLRPELAGSIHQETKRGFWTEDLQCGDYIANLLKYGYTLPLREYPPMCHLENNKSALKKPDAIENQKIHV
jgi:hypothetical protein